MGFYKVKVEGDSLVIFSKLRMQGLNRLKGGSPIGEEGLHSEEGHSMGRGGVDDASGDSGNQGKGTLRAT
ncbi:hypothetical protein J1N35_040816 [Gossypium stocksii]|uniref:RNase H type-1 domain-containing protein n=1 Tax=Gossypium stocksii TaxID=47602 RepID=A0A9D3ZIV6_9ROSI|nr:hypothetical protein J1N35_040816 [Gossypium stocksii]